MPALSQAQQRLFGMVHAYQKGELKHADKRIKSMAKSISPEDVMHYAKTKIKGLPEHVKKAFVNGFVKRANDLATGGISEWLEKSIKPLVQTNVPLKTFLHSNPATSTYNLDAVNFGEQKMYNLINKHFQSPLQSVTPTWTNFNNQPNSLNIQAHGGDITPKGGGQHTYGFNADVTALANVVKDKGAWIKSPARSVESVGRWLGKGTNDVTNINSIACNKEGLGTPELYEKYFPNATNINMTPPGNYGLFTQHFIKDLSPEGYQKSVDSYAGNLLKNNINSVVSDFNTTANQNPILKYLLPGATTAAGFAESLPAESKNLEQARQLPTRAEAINNSVGVRPDFDKLQAFTRPLNGASALVRNLRGMAVDASPGGLFTSLAPMHNYQRIMPGHWIDNGVTDLRPFAINK